MALFFRLKLIQRGIPRDALGIYLFYDIKVLEYTVGGRNVIARSRTHHTASVPCARNRTAQGAHLPRVPSEE